jgi:integrase
VPESVPYWTSIDNQLKLLDAIPEIHKPIFTFILFQAVRPSEARALKWKDIDLENEIVIIRRTFSNSKLCERTKGRNVKKREIHPFVLEVLQNLPRGLPEAFVFPNPNTGVQYSKTRLEVIFMGARKATGINLWMYAAGRHSVLSQAGMAGVSPFIIKSYAGHSSIKSSEKYVHIDVLAQRQIFERTVTRLSPAKKAKS